ncbi:MAG: M56 family metallopeptidase [Candidatus Shapirobacteria bacterium]
MLKNKPLVLLFLFLLFVSLLLGFIFAKYFPFLFRVPVYYCQHRLCSTLIKISSFLGTTLFRLLVITLLITLTKTFLDFWRVAALRRHLTPLALSTKSKKIMHELKLDKQVMMVKHVAPFVFCLGFFRTKIIISDTFLKLLTPRQLKAVLYHEKYHQDHFDALIMYLGRFWQSLLPFFPLLKDQLNHLSLDREINADHQAMVKLGSNRPLVSTLKKLLAYEVIPAYRTFPSFLDSEKNLEMRIKALLHQSFASSSFSRKNATLSLIVLVILLSLLFLPLNTVNINAAGTKEVVACLNDESCIQACRQEEHEDGALFDQLHP